MASHSSHSQDGHGHGDGHPLVGHVVPLSLLFATGLALIALTVVTVAVRYIDVGEFNIWIALGVAVVKAALVVLIFMHLRWDRTFNLLTLVGSILFVLLLITFAMMDVHQYQPQLAPGNPKGVAETLTKDAPYASIASQNLPA